MEDDVIVLQDADAERAQNVVNSNCPAAGRVYRDMIFPIHNTVDGLVEDDLMWLQKFRRFRLCNVRISSLVDGHPVDIGEPSIFGDVGEVVVLS